MKKLDKKIIWSIVLLIVGISIILIGIIANLLLDGNVSLDRGTTFSFIFVLSVPFWSVGIGNLILICIRNRHEKSKNKR